MREGILLHAESKMDSTRCSCCGEGVANVKNRRNLCNDSSKHTIPVLREILSGVCEEWVGSYLCRGCFRDIEKIIKMRRDIDVLMQQMHDRAVSAIASFPLPAAREKVGEKRASQAKVSAAKRQKVVASSSDGQSPQIVVSCACMVLAKYCFQRSGSHGKVQAL